jgi:hypothetical protein
MIVMEKSTLLTEMVKEDKIDKNIQGEHKRTVQF